MHGYSPEDVIKRDNGYWLNVHGTKTDNAERIQPIPAVTALLIKHFFAMYKIQARDYAECARVLGDYAGYTPERQKAENISFYGNRHIYNTLLTSLSKYRRKVLYLIFYGQ